MVVLVVVALITLELREQGTSLVKLQVKGLQAALVLHRRTMAALAAAAGLIPEEARDLLGLAVLVEGGQNHPFLDLQ
jgi:hypothetical protein